MGGKRVAKDYWSHDEFMARCDGKTPEQVAALEAQFYKMHGINPATDLYPPEETTKRFDAILRACLFLPPASEEERLLREQIAKDIGAS